MGLGSGLASCGIWRPVELRLYRGAKVVDCHLKHRINDGSATLTADVDVEFLTPVITVFILR